MRYARLIITLFVSIFSSAGAFAQETLAADSVPAGPSPTDIGIAVEAEVEEVDSIIPLAPEFTSWGNSLPPAEVPVPEDTNRNWWHLLRKGQLKMNDPTVEWPGFLGFCVKVYNWGDRVFSSTDPDYVVGTGKKWRARIINDNWADSYHMVIRSKFNSVMMTPLHVLWGASLQYMAVSYTYTVDLTHMLTGSPINYKKQEFGFNCARFSVDGYYYSNHGTYIRSFKGYKGYLHESFSGINMQIFGIDSYYFINGYKYSQGAAYNFSKIQKRSQGCLMAGFSYCNQDITLDFSKLPDDLLPYLKLNDLYYRFHYNDYNLLVGYGYNCVINPHWLYNITVIPGIGFNHCYEDSSDGSSKLFSVSGRAMTSFTFNSGNWFAGLQGKIRGNWYQSGPLHLFNAVESIVLSGGIRF
ncbi:MAG: DUF4421 domain-containing protein [Muribaculaceae bacterium]|nr:DUF4421 domain-containing protein [Muribaculaceae bacterium]